MSVEWSLLARDVDTGERLLEQDADRLLPTASLAKVFLLVEVADALAAGRLAPTDRVRRDAVAPVADSGLWQHLVARELAVPDAAALVGAVSDNLATNVLLDRVGLGAVQRRAAALAPGGSTLLDVVRDVRSPADPPTLSRGCAEDWARLAAALARGEVVDAEVSGRVVRWLSAGTDLSMLAGAFGLDPLAHGPDDGATWLWCKTGTDDGVRADVGVLTTGGRRIAWAALAAWDPDGADRRTGHLEALARMREHGARLVRDEPPGASDSAHDP